MVKQVRKPHLTIANVATQRQVGRNVDTLGLVHAPGPRPLGPPIRHVVVIKATEVGRVYHDRVTVKAVGRHIGDGSGHGRQEEAQTGLQQSGQHRECAGCQRVLVQQQTQPEVMGSVSQCSRLRMSVQRRSRYLHKHCSENIGGRVRPLRQTDVQNSHSSIEVVNNRVGNGPASMTADSELPTFIESPGMSTAIAAGQPDGHTILGRLPANTQPPNTAR